MQDFVSYELAKKLKEKGFQEKCIGYYDYSEEFHYNYESAISNKEIYFCHNKYDNIWHRDLIDAPTISQVLKWLREEKSIHVELLIWTEGWYYEVWCFEYNENDKEYDTKIEEQSMDYSSYERAALAGIEYVLDNLP